MSEKHMISEHPYNDESDVGIAAASLVLTVMATIFLIIELVSGTYAGPLILLAGIAYTLLIGSVAWYYYRKSQNLAIKLYENGIEYIHKNNISFWQWDTLHIELSNDKKETPGESNVLPNLPHHANLTYILRDKNDDSLKLDKRFKDRDAMLKTVFAKLMSRRDYLEQYRAGESVKIGDVTINHTGVALGSQGTIAWEQISHFGNHLGRLDIVLADGKQVSATMNGVVDGALLFEVLIQLTAKFKTNEGSSILIEQPQLADQFQSRLSRMASIRGIIFWTAIVAVAVYVYGTGIRNLMTYEYEDLVFLDWLWSAAGLLAPITAVWMIGKNVRRLLSHEVITINKSGLGYENRDGASFWAWQDISGGQLLKQYQNTGAPHIVYDVYVNDEQILRVHPFFERYGDVVNSITSYHAATHYPSLKQHLESGEVLTFTPLSIDQFGIRYQGNSYAWDDIKSYRQSNESGETQLVFEGENNQRLFAIGIFGLFNSSLLHVLLNEKVSGEVPEFVV